MNADIGTRQQPTPRQIGWGLALSLLLFPAIDMQFTAEVDWGAEDFVAFALMIGLAGLVLDAGVRLIRRPLHRAILMGAIVLAFMLAWAELAVGILPG
jgi:hypothetical protein